MQIILNGNNFPVDEPISVSELLRLLKLETQRIAIEINEEIIPKSEHIRHQIQEGDKVEIVRAIGGGTSN